MIALAPKCAAGILNLMMNLRRQMDLSCLFVTHDLSVARVLADPVGQIVEIGEPAAVLSHPQHDYIRLLSASQLVPVAARRSATPVNRGRHRSKQSAKRR